LMNNNSIRTYRWYNVVILQYILCVWTCRLVVKKIPIVAVCGM
jgi:hypothetical protein